MGHVLVLGSLNLDLVFRILRLPAAGETLPCPDSATFCGGKGANQAVACARLGASVAMIGCVGDDAAGRQLRHALLTEGIDTRGLSTVDGVASGQALILLTPDGENRIILAPGANARLTPDAVRTAADLFDGARLLVCQLEVPLDTVAAAIAEAHVRGIPVLLNPAPAIALPDELLAGVDTLVPNESEAGTLTGTTVYDRTSARTAALSLRDRGVRQVIITLGAAGILIADADGVRHVPARPVTVVDTTAAGDSFIGGLATGLVEGLALDEAADLGLQAAALCVGRPGAQAAMPYRRELKM